MNAWFTEEQSARIRAGNPDDPLEFWKNCETPDCDAKVCLGFSERYCYQHMGSAAQWLFEQDHEANP